MISINDSEHKLESLPQWAQDLIHQLCGQVQQLTLRVRELEAQLAKNSSNSGKPPSSDGPEKPKTNQSLRGKSGRKPGGQPGREGKTLEAALDPDRVEIHSPMKCSSCHGSLEEIEAAGIEKRQVFDIPPMLVIVTEHVAETKICPCCGKKNKGEFPQGINAPVQYGDRVKALAAYFLHQHLIPFERVSQIFEDVFGLSLSVGTCVNMDAKLFKNLEAFEEGLKSYLVACKVLHLDETGVRCLKKLHWIHVTSSQMATLFVFHSKRGGEATYDIGILPKYEGSVIHDHWLSYFSYQQVKHGLCNVHHLRELKFVHEQERSDWAKEMADLLLKGKKMTNEARQAGKTAIAFDEIATIEQEYRSLLLKAGAIYLDIGNRESIPDGLGKQGFNLLRRLMNRMDEVLYFMRDLSIPFSNNLAEQDLRMEKVKQKISGCFRTFCGGVISCRIRSYISTARKQGWKIIDALAEAIRGDPRMVHS